MTFPNLSLRAPGGCVAISLEKAGLLRFTRNDNALNLDLGLTIIILINSEIVLYDYFLIIFSQLI
jgi:hypothetical protein